GVTAVILAAAYLLWMYERVMLGMIETPVVAAMPDLNGREAVIAFTLVALILWIGLYPAPLLSRMEPSVRAVVERLETATVPSSAVVRIDPDNPHAYLLEMMADPGADPGGIGANPSERPVR
ncbi:MAG TPA: hypothetical protein VIL61_00020, partial [Nitrospiria bacterium]